MLKSLLSAAVLVITVAGPVYAADTKSPPKDPTQQTSSGGDSNCGAITANPGNYSQAQVDACKAQ